MSDERKELLKQFKVIWDGFSWARAGDQSIERKAYLKIRQLIQQKPEIAPNYICEKCKYWVDSLCSVEGGCPYNPFINQPEHQPEIDDMKKYVEGKMYELFIIFCRFIEIGKEKSHVSYEYILKKAKEIITQIISDARGGGIEVGEDFIRHWTNKLFSRYRISIGVRLHRESTQSRRGENKMNIKLKRDKFLCWLLGHKWYDVAQDDVEFFESLGWTQVVCLCCAKTEARPPKPLEHPNCLYTIIPNEGFGVSSKPPPEWLGKPKGEINEDKD